MPRIVCHCAGCARMREVERREKRRKRRAARLAATLAAAAAAAAAAAGCATPEPVREIIDTHAHAPLEHTPPPERLAVAPGTPSWAVEATVDGVTYWCERAGYCPAVYIGEPERFGDWRVFVASLEAAGYPNAFGGCWPGLIVLDPSAEWCPLTMPHEIGHALGLGHDPEGSVGVMRPKAGDCTL